MARSLVAARVAIGTNNGGESTSGGDQEGAEWQGQATESRVSSAGSQDTDSTSSQTEQTANGTSIDGSAEGIVSGGRMRASTRWATYL